MHHGNCLCMIYSDQIESSILRCDHIKCHLFFEICSVFTLQLTFDLCVTVPKVFMHVLSGSESLATFLVSETFQECEQFIINWSSKWSAATILWFISSICVNCSICYVNRMIWFNEIAATYAFELYLYSQHCWYFMFLHWQIWGFDIFQMV